MENSMSNQIQGKWAEIKGEVQKAWGKLTNDELEKTKGDFKSIKGLVQQRYGDTQADYEAKLKGIYDRFIDAKDEKVENVKDNLRRGA